MCTKTKVTAELWTRKFPCCKLGLTLACEGPRRSFNLDKQSVLSYIFSRLSFGVHLLLCSPLHVFYLIFTPLILYLLHSDYFEGAIFLCALFYILFCNSRCILLSGVPQFFHASTSFVSQPQVLVLSQENNKQCDGCDVLEIRKLEFPQKLSISGDKWCQNNCPGQAV